MGKFQNRLKEFWKTLSSEDIEEPQEIKFEGDLAMAMQAQERQEKSQKSLLSSWHYEGKANKDNFKINEFNNIKVESGKGKVNVQKIEDNRDR